MAIRRTRTFLLLTLSVAAIYWFGVRQSSYTTFNKPNARYTSDGRPAAVSENLEPLSDYRQSRYQHVPSPLAWDGDDSQPRPLRGHEIISTDCLLQWIGQGRWSEACLEVHLQEPRIDLVWTWVNGSDPLHRAAMARHAPTMDRKRSREHDELRYSMRSFEIGTNGWHDSRWHVVANSYPDPANTDANLGQLPQWLSTDASQINFHYDIDIFRPSDPAALSSSELATWQAYALPTFNSMAIESQLAHLPASAISDNTVFLMDDVFLISALTPSSFYTPLYGPVLQLRPDVVIKPGTSREPGELRSMRAAAAHLSRRFGDRARSYVAHNARTVPLALLHEASIAFPDVWDHTASARTRGADASEPEVHTLWMATQYIVERYREALIWSWVVAKWGGKRGVITEIKKHKMWAELGGSLEAAAHPVDVFVPTRHSRTRVEANLHGVGLPGLKKTKYAWVSSDGDPYIYLSLHKKDPRMPTVGGIIDLSVEYSGTARVRPKVCTLNWRECLGTSGDEPASDVFERLLTSPCGDCVISALVGASGSSGLSMFLPPPDSSFGSWAPPISLPLTLPEIKRFPLPRDPLTFVLRLLQRYSYAIGDTPSKFIGVLNPGHAVKILGTVDEEGAVFLCLNDDIAPAEVVGATERVLKNWWERRWPVKMDIEI